MEVRSTRLNCFHAVMSYVVPELLTFPANGFRSVPRLSCLSRSFVSGTTGTREALRRLVDRRNSSYELVSLTAITAVPACLAASMHVFLTNYPIPSSEASFLCQLA